MKISTIHLLFSKRLFYVATFCLLLFPKESFSQTKVLMGVGTQEGGGIFTFDPVDGSLTSNKSLAYPKSVQYSDLIESNGKLWGTTKDGGNGFGTIFSLDTDGTNFTIVHSFSQSDGSNPHAGVIESNGKLWGTTRWGGTNNYGVIFSISTDGTSFSVDHHFSGGRFPQSGLVEANGKLWGMTSRGGSTDAGIIYSMNTDGTSFAKVQDLSNTVGALPESNRLVLASGKLWGMSRFGGTTNNGTIFTIDIDGTNLTKVHDFDNTNGREPFGSLLLSNGKLWGTTVFGGSGGVGVIFSIETDGTGFTKVMDFDNTTGRYPYGSFIEADSKLWGITSSGGSQGGGVVFSIETDGTGFNKVYELDFNDFLSSYSGLLHSGGKLWGMTTSDPAIFSVNTDGTAFTKHHDFDLTKGHQPFGRLLAVGDQVWGMTNRGGANNEGTIFSYNSEMDIYTKVHDFDDTNGAVPFGGLTEVDGKLWGMTYDGGSNDFGAIFNMNADGTNFSLIHSFNNNNGRRPYGNLVESANKLWGTTELGGANRRGVIFTIDKDGTNQTVVHNFEDASGIYPFCDLVEADGKLWGTTSSGGDHSSGVIFSIDADGTNYTVVHHFRYDFMTNSGGTKPIGGLIAKGSTLWGATSEGGSRNDGTIYSINTDGTAYTEYHDFTGTDGEDSEAPLVEYNGKFYGITRTGGSKSKGVIFSINTDGSGFQKEIDLDSANGNPRYGGLILADNPKTSQNITFNAVTTLTYGDPDFILSATSDSPNPITFSSSDPSIISVVGDMATIHAAGTVTLSASQAGDETYAPARADQVVIVDPVLLMMGADILGKTYGDSDPPLTFSILAGSLIGGDDLSGALGRTAGEGVGGYDILLNTLTAGPNYEIMLLPSVFSINERILDIQAHPQTSVYGDSEPELTYSVVGGSLINGDELTGNLFRAEGTGVGIFAITQGTLTAGLNYIIQFTGNDLTVTERPVTVTIADQNKLYGEQDPELEFDITSGSLVPGDGFTGSVSREAGEDAGAYNIVQNTLALSSNYDLAVNEGVLTIDPEELIVQADDIDITFGEAIPELTVTYSGFVNSEDESVLDLVPGVSTTATALSDAGEYEITLGEGSDNNYTLYLFNGTLTINKADQAILFDALENVDLAATNTVTLVAISDANLPVEFTLEEGDGSISGNTLTINKVGNFTVAARQPGNTNYNPAAFVTQSFAVTDSRKTDQTITFEAIDDQVYGEQLTLGAMASSDLPVSYSLTAGAGTITDGVLSIEGIGAYEVVASQNGDANYNPATSVTRQFTVAKATLTVIADDQTIQEGDAIPELTFTYAGFKLSDDVSVLNAEPGISTTATELSAAGEYEIRLEGGSDDLYNFTLVNGMLTIESVLNVRGTELTIYPNPVVDRLQVKGMEVSTMRLMTLEGKEVQLLKNVAEMDVSRLSPGKYILQLQDKSGGLSTHRIIKR